MIVLASASTARQQLLRDAAIPFETVPSRARELRGRGRTLFQTVLENAMRKARAVARLRPGRWILAADTMIGFEGRIYGKPPTRKAALRLLSSLAGKTHQLATGVVLLNGRRTIRNVAITRVTVRALSVPQLARILSNQDPTKVAGGYCIERKRDPLIERIDGSYSNVVGLPMEWLRKALAHGFSKRDRRRV